MLILVNPKTEAECKLNTHVQKMCEIIEIVGMGSRVETFDLDAVYSYRQFLFQSLMVWCRYFKDFEIGYSKVQSDGLILDNQYLYWIKTPLGIKICYHGFYKDHLLDKKFEKPIGITFDLESEGGKHMEGFCEIQQFLENDNEC